MQIWRSRCEINKKLSLYVQFKTTFTKENYVSVINIAKFRSLFASFRGSSHSLSIETGRHYSIERENRMCPYCDCYIEDEYHFVMTCPLYSNLRSNYIVIILLQIHLLKKIVFLCPAITRIYKILQCIYTMHFENDNCT